jgi:nitroreductase
MDVIHAVLDLARWAPSGDNVQPWRFEIQSETAALIHGYDTRHHCVYDLDGCASQLSHGAVLETVELAATRFQCRARISLISDDDPGHIVYSVRLEKDSSITAESPLVEAIAKRSVQRRPMPTGSLAADVRRSLECSVDSFKLVFLDSIADRWRMATLNARNAHLRLTIPEAYAVHRAVIAWGCKTSEDRLPDASLGAGPILLAMMRSAMSSWDRLHFLNRFAGGTLLPRLALDFLPGLRCASHFALIAPHEPKVMSDRVAAGRAIQRFWLTATHLGLQMQPAYTPLVFARYSREGRPFTRSLRAERTAREVARRLNEILGPENAKNAVFLGRLGPARPIGARSLRLPLERLVVNHAPQRLVP